MDIVAGETIKFVAKFTEDGEPVIPEIPVKIVIIDPTGTKVVDGDDMLQTSDKGIFEYKYTLDRAGSWSWDVISDDGVLEQKNFYVNTRTTEG